MLNIQPILISKTLRVVVKDEGRPAIYFDGLGVNPNDINEVIGTLTLVANHECYDVVKTDDINTSIIVSGDFVCDITIDTFTIDNSTLFTYSNLDGENIGDISVLLGVIFNIYGYEMIYSEERALGRMVFEQSFLNLKVLTVVENGAVGIKLFGTNFNKDNIFVTLRILIVAAEYLGYTVVENDTDFLTITSIPKLLNITVKKEYSSGEIFLKVKSGVNEDSKDAIELALYNYGLQLVSKDEV